MASRGQNRRPAQEVDNTISYVQCDGLVSFVRRFPARDVRRVRFGAGKRSIPGVIFDPKVEGFSATLCQRSLTFLFGEREEECSPYRGGK